MKNIKNKILQIINNKNFKRIAIVVILFALVFSLCKSISNSNKDLILVNNRVDRRQFQIYKKKENGNGYEVYNGSGFPVGHTLNTSLTTCVDNNKNPLTDVYTYTNGVFSLTSNKTAFCTLYFDPLETLYRTLKNSQYTERYTGLGYVGESNSSDRYFSTEIYQPLSRDSANAPSEHHTNVLFGGFCWEVLRTTENEGTKLIYNGVPKTSYDEIGNIVYTCDGTGTGLIMRNDVVTGYFSNNNSLYYYGTDFAYNASTGKFSVAGDTMTARWNTQSANNLTVKDMYTCMSTSSTGTCNYITKILGYIDNTHAKAINYQNSSTDKIGISMYNKTETDQYNLNGSPGEVGYMHNTLYYAYEQYSELYIPPYANVSMSNTTDANYLDYYYADTIRDSNCYDEYDYNLNTYVYICDYELINPVLGSDLINNNNLDSLVGYFTFFSDDPTYTTGSNVNCIFYDNINSNNITYFVVNSASVDALDKVVYGPAPVSGNIIYDHTYDGYVFGYMTSPTMHNVNFMVGSSASYDYVSGKYSLNNATSVSFEGSGGSHIYTPSGIVINGKYACVSDDNNSMIHNSTNCDSIGYIISTDVQYVDGPNPSAYSEYGAALSIKYLKLTGGETTVAGALTTMFRDPNVNTNDSDAKKLLDIWYEEMLLDYDSHIDKDEIFCNNRDIDYSSNRGSNWNPSTAISCYSSSDDYLSSCVGTSNSYENEYFNYYSLIFADRYSDSSGLTCSNKLDAFSVNETEKGNGALTYPIGLPTFYELQHFYWSHADTLISGTPALYTPFDYFYAGTAGAYITCYDCVGDTPTNSYQYYRPAIALKKGHDTYTTGTGTISDPYLIDSGLYDVSINNDIFNHLNKGIPGVTYELRSDIYDVTSFKLNGTTINGNSFKMPKGNANITDIVYSQTRYYVNESEEHITLNRAYTPGDTVTLKTNNYKEVLSFKMNGTLIEDSSFTMPSEDVTITDVTYSDYDFVETETHNPFPSATGTKTYYEKTFDGATAITVELTYQTYNNSSSYSHVKLYSAPNTVYSTYANGNLQKKSIYIQSNYIKIVWFNNYSSSAFTNKYGFSAKITPDYS